MTCEKESEVRSENDSEELETYHCFRNEPHPQKADLWMVFVL